MYNDFEFIKDLKDFLKPDTVPRMLPFKIGGDQSITYEEPIDSEGYTSTKTITERIFYEEVEFKYKLNSDGFRSRHFNQFDKSKTNILYTGCSFTYGVGQPEEYTWPSLLTDLIKNKDLNKDVEHFNIAYPGASIHEIVRNCFIFFEKFGHPDYLFMLVPDVNRSISYIESSESYQSVNPSGHNLSNKMPKELINAIENYSPKNNWLIASDLISMLEAYCNSNNIKFIWTTWIRHQSKCWSYLGHKNFFDPQFEEQEMWYTPKDNEKPPFAKKIKAENVNNLPYWEFARDGRHPGTCWTTLESEKFFNEINKRYKDE